MLRRLGRGIQRDQNHRALAILADRQVHTCFNLLMFDPDSDLASLWENLAFMATQHSFPLNFCRVEVYAGTALDAQLRNHGRLQGDYMGQTYIIADSAAQRAYELFWRVFAPRNFGEGGMHHESMRLDYYLHLLRHFHPDRVSAPLWRRCKALVADLNRDSALRMSLLLDRAEAIVSPAEIEATAAELRQGRALADARFNREAAILLGRLQTLARDPSRTHPTLRAARPAIAAAMLASAWVGADSALAQDDDGGSEGATTAEETQIPELDEPAAEPAPDLVPVELPDRLPDTHMCEAAPPPWDLYNLPAPPPDITERVLQIDAVAAPRIKYLEVFTASADIQVDSKGKVSKVTVWTTPHTPAFQAELEAALEGVVFEEPYRDHSNTLTLWHQFVRQVQEVVE